jgi:hypothetical protein
MLTHVIFQPTHTFARFFVPRRNFIRRTGAIVIDVVDVVGAHGIVRVFQRGLAVIAGFLGRGRSICCSPVLKVAFLIRIKILCVGDQTFSPIIV